MKRPRNKFIVSGVAVFGIAVLVASGFALKRPVLEEWYLWKLDSENDEERKVAAEKLGEMGSVRAIPPLVEILQPEPGEPNLLHYTGQALARIGPPSVPALIRLFRDESEDRQKRWVARKERSEETPKKCSTK